MTHPGSCHCGRIAYEVEGNCSHCAFGKDSKGADTVAINVRCLPDLDLAGLKIKQVDGRSLYFIRQKSPAALLPDISFVAGCQRRDFGALRFR